MTMAFVLMLPFTQDMLSKGMAGPRVLHTDFLEAARQTQTCRENAQLTGAVFQHLAQSQELGLVVGMSLSHIMKYLFGGQLQLLANGDPGRQKVMVQVIRFLPPVWEI